MTDVTLLETAGNQYFDGPLHQLGLIVAEQDSALLVDAGNESAVVYDDNGVGRRFEKLVREALAFLERERHPGALHDLLPQGFVESAELNAPLLNAFFQSLIGGS